VGTRWKTLLLGAVSAALVLPGAASAAAPQPIVHGNVIVDAATSKRFVPRGVNFPGFEYACQQGWGYGADGTAPEEVASTVSAMASWKINAVRLPLNQDCWLGEDGLPGGELTAAGYRDSVEAFTEALGAAGMVAILDLHWTGHEGLVADGLRPMPDGRSPAFWRSVAQRFRENRSVIFDLFNEPHSRWNPDGTNVFELSWACWAGGGCQVPAEIDTAPSSGSSWYEATGLSTLVDAVRSVGAGQPIVLSGIDYANDLRGWSDHAPTDGQLIAGFHNYPGQRCRTVACWDHEIAPLAERVPVLTAEVGQNDCGAPDHVERYLNWADERSIGYLGWAWWALPELGCGNFALISDLDGTPLAPVGTLLHDHLADLARAPDQPDPDPEEPDRPDSGRPTAVGPRESVAVKRRRSGLRIRRVRWKRPVLRVKVGVSPKASFGVDVGVRLANGRRLSRLVPIRSGVGRLTLRVPRRTAPRMVVASYPGDQRLRPAKRRARVTVSSLTRPSRHP